MSNFDFHSDDQFSVHTFSPCMRENVRFDGQSNACISQQNPESKQQWLEQIIISKIKDAPNKRDNQNKFSHQQ